ncbi:hypothetical protein ACQ4PT_024418 [Festuca glaucescens]
MASSSSSSSEAAPLFLARQDSQDQEDEAAMAAAPSGRSQQQQEVMRSWAETMLCYCGADCGRLWRRVVLRKWLNVGAGSGDSDFSADEDDDEPDHQGIQMKDVPYADRICRPATPLAQYIDATELRIFVGTWNVGGRVPPTDLDIQDWLAMEEPADIYVLGFQEIVPLNAGNIFGAEDDHPVAVWENIIRETLNKKYHSDPPSPSKFNPSDYLVMEDDLLSEADNESEGELHPLIEQDNNVATNDSGVHLLQDGASFTSLTHDNSNGFPEDFVALTCSYQLLLDSAAEKFVFSMLQGSISVSMSIYQTPFCFVCCHLTSGEKDGNLIKRNADVEEILRRTVFNPDHRKCMPKGIYDHERIIWFGDLNYRLNLSFESTHELISREDWDGLFENDQLRRELMKGRTFDGWIEDVISFPPTYKYEFNSEKYASDEPKSARRTPAWCDRILSHGKGIRLASYKMAELNLSDHRPVYAIYMAEVEILAQRKLQEANIH